MLITVSSVLANIEIGLSVEICLSPSIQLILISPKGNLSRKKFRKFPFLRKVKHGHLWCPISPCLPHFTSGEELLRFFFPYFFGDHFAIEVLKWEFSLNCPTLDGPLNMWCISIFHFCVVLEVYKIPVCFCVNLYFEKPSELLVIAVLMFPPFHFWKYKQIVKCNNFIVFNESSVCFLDIIFHHFNAFVWAKGEFCMDDIVPFTE